MYCVHCGTLLPDAARVCSKCGQPLAAPPASAPFAVRTPAPLGEPIPSHMTYAIVSTVCLGIAPIGVAAIFFAGQVNAKLAAGDVAGARRASEWAQRLSAISMGSALVILIGILLLLFIH
jgi:hypothetical protein